MATHKSALKKSKRDIARRTRNRSGKSALRTALKKFRLELAENAEGIKDKLPSMISHIDRAAKHGFIHQNAANRLKSRLSQQCQEPASA